jgi:hypothetical protein
MTEPFSRREFLGYTAATISAAGLAAQAADDAPKVRIGMVGLDTSHVTVFDRYFNRDNNRHPELQNLRVTAAFPAGNPAFPLSKDRIDGFTKEVRELGVEVVPSLAALLPLVDAVLLESVETGHRQLEKRTGRNVSRDPGTHWENGPGGHSVRLERNRARQQLLRLFSARGCHCEVLPYAAISDSRG